jgi:Skp family chaperone for outer membrane proteins
MTPVPFFAGLALLAALSSAVQAADPPPRIAVVDAAVVLRKLVSWQRAQERLDAERAAAEKKLADAKKELDRLRAELDYFRADSPEHERRRAKLAAAQQRWLALRDRLRAKLAESARKIRAAAEKEIRAGIAAYAKERGLALVLDARTAFFVADGRDISLRVARDMNKRYKERPVDE